MHKPPPFVWLLLVVALVLGVAASVEEMQSRQAAKDADRECETAGDPLLCGLNAGLRERVVAFSLGIAALVAIVVALAAWVWQARKVRPQPS